MTYTIVITETGGDQQDSDTTVNGPHYHVGAGVVSNVVRGLRKNRNYSARVLVVSVTGTSESNTYLFSKWVPKDRNWLKHHLDAKVMTAFVSIGKVASQVYLSLRHLLTTI